MCREIGWPRVRAPGAHLLPFCSCRNEAQEGDILPTVGVPTPGLEPQHKRLLHYSELATKEKREVLRGGQHTLGAYCMPESSKPFMHDLANTIRQVSLAPFLKQKRHPERLKNLPDVTESRRKSRIRT